MARTPSPLQQAILDYVANERGNLLIQARAGTGKTSTLEMIADVLPSNARAVFLAFNKSIATELSARLPFPASTFHALGFRALGRVLLAKNRGRRVQVDANKCGTIFDAVYGRDMVAVRSAVLKLVSLLKNSAMLPDAPEMDVDALVSHFDIEWEDDSVPQSEVVSMARSVLSASNDITTAVDFDDMLYGVVLHNVKLETFDYVLVDESQDTNEIQRVILRRLMGPKSRLIAVGDAAQAIYGFRGASHDAMQLIRDEFDCRELPLSISYRCPKEVIRIAQEYVPDISARDNAPTGTVLSPLFWKLGSFLPTDLIVCRNTAPLVGIAYKMLASRRPCKILGREIGKGLTSLIKKLAGKRGSLETLPDLLSEYREREVAIAYKRGQEGKAQSVADKCDAIMCLLDSMTSDDISRGIPGLCDIIEGMFSDSKNGCTTLATVHKSKGLESPRVFIIDRQLMPSKYARQEWQQIQERNLIYVAVTRSLDTLVYLDSKTVVE